jgi:hypothetical protein
MDRGEEHCPLVDDRDVLIEKMRTSDGVVIATPNYAFQVSGLTKTFLDRVAFVLHRPCFFGKTFTGIVAQGIYGGHKIVKYLDFVGKGLGFDTVQGACITTLEPVTEKQQQETAQTLSRLARRYYARLDKPGHPAPTWFRLMLFRLGRTSMRLELDERSRDYRYYAEKGWFESDYYYPTRLGPLKRGAGKLFDGMAARLARSR